MTAHGEIRAGEMLSLFEREQSERCRRLLTLPLFLAGSNPSDHRQILVPQNIQFTTNTYVKYLVVARST